MSGIGPGWLRDFCRHAFLGTSRNCAGTLGRGACSSESSVGSGSVVAFMGSVPAILIPDHSICFCAVTSIDPRPRRPKQPLAHVTSPGWWAMILVGWSRRSFVAPYTGPK